MTKKKPQPKKALKKAERKGAMEDTEYLPPSQAGDPEMTQEEIDTAMPGEDAGRARVGEDPLITEDDVKELPQFKENEAVDCGGFSFEVTRVVGPNRYLIKVVD